MYVTYKIGPNETLGEGEFPATPGIAHFTWSEGEKVLSDSERNEGWKAYTAHQKFFEGGEFNLSYLISVDNGHGLGCECEMCDRYYSW